jgi:hypothetical protein
MFLQRSEFNLRDASLSKELMKDLVLQLKARKKMTVMSSSSKQLKRKSGKIMRMNAWYLRDRTLILGMYLCPISS